jgi:NADH/NAD ratio-sensing transcriptional regulator Rex
MSHTLQTLTFSGYSYDWMTLNDYLEEDKPYKAVIFLNLFSISAEKQQQLLKKLRRPGVTAIWNFAPCTLDVPAGVFLKQENLALSLAFLNNKLRA